MFFIKTHYTTAQIIGVHEIYSCRVAYFYFYFSIFGAVWAHNRFKVENIEYQPIALVLKSNDLSQQNTLQTLNVGYLTLSIRAQSAPYPKLQLTDELTTKCSLTCIYQKKW